MKRRYLKIAIEFLFIVLLTFWMLNLFGHRSNMPLLEPDEAAWIYSGYYFNLYFLQFDLGHKDWYEYDAFDHPPLVKYIVGGALFLKGYRIDSLDAKRAWRSIPMNQYDVYYGLLMSKIPKDVLPTTRFAIFLFHFIPPLIVCFHQKVLRDFVRHAFRITLGDSSPFPWIFNGNPLRPRPSVFFHALRGGMHLVSEIGEESLRDGGVHHLFSRLFDQTEWTDARVRSVFGCSDKKQVLYFKTRREALGVGIFCLRLSYPLFEPSFLHTGIQGLLKMFEQRFLQIHSQQELFRNAALYSISSRLSAALNNLFFEYSWLYRLTHIPVDLILFLLGTYYSLRKRDPILILILVFFIALPIFLIPLNWKRYYFPIYPFRLHRRGRVGQSV